MSTFDHHHHKGPGLARGPAALVGAMLLTFGLAAMINHNDFPEVSSQFPDGSVSGSAFLGFEVNGWTNWLCAVAGSVVLFGSAQHLIAKLVSLAVGLALAGASLLGLVNGNIVALGAANTATVIGLAGAAAVLLLNAFSPRAGRTDTSSAAMVTVALPTVEQTTYTTPPVTATAVTAPNGSVPVGESSPRDPEPASV